MIVGADGASDADIVGKASTLYDRFGLRRVYYSAFSPIPDASAVLPLQRPPLIRARGVQLVGAEHRPEARPRSARSLYGVVAQAGAKFLG